MHEIYSKPLSSFGLLPEPERNPGSFFTSCAINIVLAALLIALGTFAHQEIQVRKMESTQIYFPKAAPREIRVKVKLPPQAKLPPPVELQVAKLEAPRIFKSITETKPETKSLPMVKETLALPVTEPKPQIVLAPQPKLAIAAAPAHTPQQYGAVELAHLGDLNGVKPNPDAMRPATITALGNPYGGAQAQSALSREIFGPAGLGNGTISGAKIGGSGGGGSGGEGRVMAARFPGAATSTLGNAALHEEAKATPPILISHAEPIYTAEARQLKIQGDVVLRVTITASGEMLVQSVIRGLGHGLDESAMRSAPTYKFKPATRDGQPVEFTTNIIIKFQTV